MTSPSRRVIVHLAAKVGPKGEISPLCAEPKPRKLGKHERWTITPGYVTCKVCKAMA
jgi:hypothetical protein